MSRYARSHLSDPSLLQSAATHAGRERNSTADLLADLAEIDERRLYLPAAYPSMFAYCVGELHLCEQAALKRIQAARAARRFPAIFPAVAEGRLHLTAVVLLAPHLAEHNAEELLGSATGRTATEIERFLAARFPKSDLLAWVAPIPPASPARPESPGVASGACQLSSRIVQNETVPARAGGRATPLSSESFEVQFTLSREGHDRLCYARELLSHEIPSGDIAQVFEKLLEHAIPRLERRKFAATERPRTGHRRSADDSRHIPDHVRRAVWERDGGQCTFVSETGHRCQARSPLEFDHIEAFSRGGETTVGGIRLLCRAHNQHQAERTFGSEFMRQKRVAAAEARAAAKAQAQVADRTRAAIESMAPVQAAAAAQAVNAELAAAAAEQAAATERARELDVVPWLRRLGFSASEARQAAARCDDMPDDATLEDRVRVALSCFRVRGTRILRAAC